MADVQKPWADLFEMFKADKVVLYVSTSGASAQKHSLHIGDRWLSGLGGASAGGNYRPAMFNAIARTIQMMGQMPEGHPYKLEDDVVSAAVDLVGVLENQHQLVPPKIFVVDPETLVLKWKSHDSDSYISVSSGEVDFSEIDNQGAVKSAQALGMPGKVDLQPFFKSLGFQSVSMQGGTTSMAGNDLNYA